MDSWLKVFESCKKKEDVLEEAATTACRNNNNNNAAAYYGDYGMEDNIYGENGFLPVREQERLLHQAMKDQHKATSSTANKGSRFAVKKK